MKNTKVILSLLAVALAGGIALTGCGGGKNKKDGSSGEGSNPTTEPSGEPSSEPDPEPVYTLTETEYVLLVNTLTNPKLVIDSNFTVSGFMDAKFDNGKIEMVLEGDLTKFDIDVSTYNSSTTTANGDMYYFDKDDSKWYHSTAVPSMQELYMASGLYLLMTLPTQYSDLTYNENKRSYSANSQIEDMNFAVEFWVVDGQLTDCNITGEITVLYHFSDYGTTVVEMPTEYVEDAE